MRTRLVLPLLLTACATTPAKKPEPTPTPVASPSPTPAPEAALTPPPVLAPDEKIVDELHGVKVADPFRKLENAEDPETQAWMKAQDAYTRAVLAKLPGREALVKRFNALYYVDSVQPPIKRGGRYFYARTHADKEKAIIYWRAGETGIENVLLDPNGWSKDGTVSLGVWVPSWDGKRVVFAQRANAADEATLHVMDVDTGEISNVDVIPGGKYADPSWTPDGSGFYYELSPIDPKIPLADRPGYTEIRFHKLGEEPSKDALIRERTGNPSTFLAQSLSRDGKYLFVYVQRGWNETDLYLRDLKKDKAFRLLVQGKDATYNVEAWNDELYIVTDEGAPRKRIFKASAAKPERKNWKELVAEDKNATLQDASVIGGKLVLNYLRDAASELRTVGLDGKGVSKIALPGIGSVAAVRGNPDEADAFFSFSSFTTPLQVYRTAVKAGEPKLWAKVELPIDTSKYETEQVFYSSKDGTKVPMFLVHRKGLEKNGNNPTLLYGYGGFDVSLMPNFRASIYPWLEAGGIYAVANLRGGGEYGKEWHDAGKGSKKQNVFDDFTAAAQYLIDQKWTQPSRLAINGGSNGGLLMGAAMTQHPELYGAVVCAVPLLDMVRYHRFGSGKTWIPEYGSADVAADFPAIYAYSPYHHVQKGVKYPPLLMLSADHDDRVDPMHARKFVAAVQWAEQRVPGAGPALLRIETNAGHGGADQVKKAIDYSADMYVFLFDALKVAPPK
jgi:prolyl oligopeptidase